MSEDKREKLTPFDFELRRDDITGKYLLICEEYGMSLIMKVIMDSFEISDSWEVAPQMDPDTRCH